VRTHAARSPRHEIGPGVISTFDDGSCRDRVYGSWLASAGNRRCLFWRSTSRLPCALLLTASFHTLKISHSPIRKLLANLEFLKTTFCLEPKCDGACLKLPFGRKLFLQGASAAIRNGKRTNSSAAKRILELLFWSRMFNSLGKSYV
jgi:hypothetical protein